MSLQTAIERSASPAAVAVALERLSDAVPGVQARLVADPALRDAVFAVTGASRSLTELLVSDPAALEVLADLGQRPVLQEGSVEDGPPPSGGLRRWMRLELLRIAARDLTGLDDLPVVGRGLARLADEVLVAAAVAAGADPGLAVIGMGKLGGCELNYSSDIDIMFVGDPRVHDRTARAILDIARTCYRVDVDLRPEGRDGPLVRSLESYEAYWERWAHTWEFQALLKARPVAGDADLGAAFLERARARVWERPFTLDDLRAVRSMKARSEEMLAKKGLTDREVKRGRGGIRDIEFSVQLLQLVHGRADPALRSPTTLDALAELGSSGYVDPSDARALDAAYRLLRTVEHRLQLVHEQQVHTLPAPTDLAGRDRLARVMGYRDTAEATAGDLLDRFLRRQQANVRSIHQHLFFRPLLDALTANSANAALMSEEAVATRLEAFGFTDAKRTRLALRELTKGLTRSSRLMQQMLPLLLGWLSEAPDPDLGLLGLRVLAAGPAQATELATAFRESPEAARRLCTLLGTSRRLSETLEHHPDMIPALGQPDALLRRRPESLLLGASAALAWRDQVEDRQRGLLRYKRREELRVAAGDVLGLAPPDEDQVVVTACQLTTLAEASLQAALDALAPSLPFAVIAMGRFGGAELSYASDLDLLFVYDGQNTVDVKAADFKAAEKVAESLVRFLAGTTPATRIYPIDLGLRPEGKDGPLARSLDGYATYYDRWAQTWERQALVRARFVAGDADVGRRFMEIIEPHVWGKPLAESDIREIRRIKARIERERIPHAEDPQFHLKLGRGSLSDVEFTAQLLQLRHGVRATGTMDALVRLEQAGVLDPDDREVLADAYRFCERARNRWFLVKGAPGDSLPTKPEQMAALARSLGMTAADLRENYRRVTRRSRNVVERVFYGKVD
ncbi:MAG: [glutamine synthetase] adenylyltransferase / [glutamine synthetase]-adenylyl-L-tyrosine [Actinomycetota bacterium]|jgi:glutamate-ammonia-ligase adenylyltransferase|nr:[glutamine synthetase] adenylyltransferase / [glutamine synthetase]-adenylyl-L-tyrosine [Actinomycetota bacterium]